MNCNQISSLIIEQVDGNLDELQNQAVFAHANSCAYCKDQLEHEQLLQDSFKSMALKEAPNDFYDGMVDRVFNATISINKNKPKAHFSDRLFSNAYTGFSSAIAASLIFWLVLSPTHQSQSFDNVSPSIASTVAHSSTASDIELALNNIEHIRLSFKAPENFTHVTMTLNLPEQIELKGFPGQRKISWETSLNSGINILTLPVIAKSLGHAVVEAKISNHKKSKTFKIHMNSKLGDQASMAIEV